jgi:hypothetical protein
LIRPGRTKLQHGRELEAPGQFPKAAHGNVMASGALVMRRGCSMGKERTLVDGL